MTVLQIQTFRDQKYEYSPEEDRRFGDKARQASNERRQQFDSLKLHNHF